MNETIERLTKEFELGGYREQKPSLAFVRARKDQLVALLRELRDREGYSHLSFMTAIDYIEDGIFRLTYMLHNYAAHHGLGVQVDIGRDGEEMDSIHTLWAQAWTYQRELREMYGIRFPGSPRIDDDFCLEGWEDIPPMRKEFDTAAFSAERFGFREGRASEEPREHMQQVIYPERGQ